MDLRKLEGVIPAVLTPYPGYEETIPEIVKFLVERGVSALFVVGSFGEGPRIPPEQRMKTVEKYVETAGGKTPVIVHVGAADMETVRRLARHAGEVGADAVAAVAPFYYRYDLKSLITYYREIARAAKTSVLVYNNPPRTQYSITVEWFEKIASEVPEVIGMKDSSGDPVQLIALAENLADKYLIAGGADSLIFYHFAIGLPAQVSGLASIYPEFPVKIHEAVKKGSLREARKLQVHANHVREILAAYGEPVSAYKEALKLRGIDPGPPYPPAHPLSSEEREELKKRLSQVKPP